MAGELKGDFFEAVVDLAIRQASLPARVTKHQYTTHATPPGFQKELDFYWANAGGMPEAIIMVTHTDSQKDWSRKFWRNAGELIEAKHQTADRCYVVSIVFDSETKSGLELLAEQIMDRVIALPVTDYPNIVEAARICSSYIKKGDSFSEKCKAVAQIHSMRSEIQSLAREIESCFKHRRAKNKGLSKILDKAAANMPAEDCRPVTIPNLRKILGRLACCDDLLVEEVLSNCDKPSHNYVNDIAFGLSVGVLRTAIGKRLSNEAFEALSCMEKPVARAVMDAFDPAVRARFRMELEQALSLSLDQVAAFVQFANSGLSAAKIAKVLKDDFTTPGVLCAQKGYTSPWFFSFCLDFAKAFHEKRNDFGYGWLTRNQAASAKIRFWAPKYVSGNAMLPREEISSLSKFLCRQIVEWKGEAPEFKAACDRVMEYKLHNILINKIDCHVGDPMDYLVEVYLNRHGVPAKRQPIYTFLNELADIRSAGFLTGFVIGKTMILCRSVSEGGRDHKVRELCGFIKATFMTGTGRILKDNVSIERRFLVIDGDYRQSDLDSLRASGFDRFFSALELSNLTGAIV